MTDATVAPGTLSEAEHRAHLRRAVVASTVGTTIEWYDFLIYSTMTGLVFGQVFFAGSDPLTDTLKAFGVFFIGFVARPIGAGEKQLPENQPRHDAVHQEVVPLDRGANGAGNHCAAQSGLMLGIGHPARKDIGRSHGVHPPVSKHCFFVGYKNKPIFSG